VNVINGRPLERLGFISFCWTVIALHFLLSGFVRGFIFRQLSDYLFFIPLPIVICILITSLSIDSKIRFFDFFCIALSLLLFLYQFILLMDGSINSKTAIYGWFLYGLPFLGMAAAQKCFNVKILERIIFLFEICLIPNLFFAVMQAVVGDSRYFSAGFGEGLQSAFGVQRATGTFSSPAGYALYLTLTTSLLLVRNGFKKVPNHRNLISFSLLLFQLPISGSRTAIMSVALIFFMHLIFRKRASLTHATSGKSKLLVLVASLSLVGIFWKFSSSSTVQATLTRFLTANEIDPPLTRLFAQLKVDFRDVGFLHGSGLGSRANGTTVFGVDWVEFDVQRVLVEAGLVIGVIILVFRVILVLRILENFSKNPQAFELPLIAAVVPVLIFGQLMGQGTISAGTWLGLYILEYLRPEKDLRNQYKIRLGLSS